MSKSKLKPGRYCLVVIAHPDDEAIFFGTTILQSKIPVHIVCATDGNADGLGAQRKKDFAKSARILGVASLQSIGLPDIFAERLDRQKIISVLQSLPTPKVIFTHGPLGEYGHPHHQDVCLATHEAFAKHKNIFGLAFNTAPDLIFKPTPENFKIKIKLFSQVYFEETKRFINMLPVSHIESHCRYDLKEVKAIHDFLSSTTSVLDEKVLKKTKWFIPYLQHQRATSLTRPF